MLVLRVQLQFRFAKDQGGEETSAGAGGDLAVAEGVEDHVHRIVEVFQFVHRGDPAMEFAPIGTRGPGIVFRGVVRVGGGRLAGRCGVSAGEGFGGVVAAEVVAAERGAAAGGVVVEDVVAVGRHALAPEIADWSLEKEKDHPLGGPFFEFHSIYSEYQVEGLITPTLLGCFGG